MFFFLTIHFLFMGRTKPVATGELLPYARSALAVFISFVGVLIRANCIRRAPRIEAIFADRTIGHNPGSRTCETI